MPADPYHHTPPDQPPLADELATPPVAWSPTGHSTPVLLSRGGPPDALDWCEFTTPAGASLAATCDALPAPEPWRQERGSRWYATRYTSGPLTVQTDHRAGHPGHHVTIPGDACRLVAAADLWPATLALGTVSRLDLFLDDHESRLDLDHLSQLAQAYHWTSPAGARSARTLWEAASAGAPPGRTVYIGTRSSERYLRIYDKAVETRTTEPWVRVELQTRDRLAAVLAADLADDWSTLTDTIRRQLRRMVAWTDGDTTRRRRAATAAFWDDFLAQAQPARPLPPDRFPTFTRSLEWLNSQVGTTLAYVYEHITRTAGDVAAQEWLIGLLADGFERLTNHQLGRLLPDPTPGANLGSLYRNEDLTTPPAGAADRLLRKRLKARVEKTARPTTSSSAP